MFTALRRPKCPRRGVTLVEMLVVVALVVLMMVILVQIFQSALGAMSASRTTQELDVVLRSIDSTIRADLAGVTAKMTPPNDPALKQGYLEYIEGAPADAQGEDTDDALAFTTKAREGQVFTGRQYLSGTFGTTGTVNSAIQPITITSQVAEVIYFLRNGNLYRRVLLVLPDRAKSLKPGTTNSNATYPVTFGPLSRASWQGMNDISCRPLGYSAIGFPIPVPNDLGDLTNRENRFARPRFSNDFTGANGVPEGIPDDNNGDGVNDYYPTLYFDGVGYSYTDPNNSNLTIWTPNRLTAESVGYPNTASLRVERGTANSYDVYAFPFIFPGMYSVPDGATVNTGTVTPPNNIYGWRHGLFPTNGQNNHSPLDVGDNLPAPAHPQTWWGFPTWRETMTPFTSATVGWADPVISVNTNPTNTHQQPLGLRPLNPTATYSLNRAGFLTPLTQVGTGSAPPFSDNAGSTSFVPVTPLNHLWEDDLILTNVRSFDVKAYDPDASLYTVTNANGYVAGPFSAGYQDLGYGSTSPNYAYLAGLLGTGAFVPATNANAFQTTGSPVGFGHEGRIPPIPADLRINPSRPTYIDANGNLQTNYVGDNHAGVIRLTHTFDTWSTAYTNAPATDILLNGYSATALPIYPSFPPPYPSALRGIQIQIRVVDPRNERSKVLTIRHDFTDKLTN